MNKNGGYILFINLILISLIGLFIPLLIQQQRINFKIIENRAKEIQTIEAAESALIYQLYFLEQKNLLLDREIYLKEELKVKLKGEEGAEYFYLRASAGDDYSYTAEMKLDKDDLRIINKKNYRSD